MPPHTTTFTASSGNLCTVTDHPLGLLLDWQHSQSPDDACELLAWLNSTFGPALLEKLQNPDAR